MAASVVEYATLTLPFGSERVVTFSGPPASAMVMLNPLVTVAAGEPESLTCTVKEKLPFCEGVPEI